ncbi:hypothetical protein [Sporosarcina obsidiansis]|uniref:hypothetical protein n=1 Tax=Sporosarcina obsidiansis TaxID=2660748 RepID=UPI00129A1723|nr:hypothetical protein [Sporosarcina obsidiansis]
MAKLTARFDIQDKISKKLRAIRGEIDSLQRARDRVNKPITMSMRVKDMATKILKRTQMFVLKDLAKTHAIVLEAKDKATKTMTAVSNFMKRRMPRTHAVFVSAKDKASPILQKVGKFVRKNIARTQIMTILATDRAMPIIRRVGSLARSTLSKGYNFTVRGVDMASRVIGRVSSYAMTAIPKVRTFTIRAINAASSVIGTVKRALFSIPTLITVTLAAVGVGKLSESTVGAAMTFEGYEVSMDHWLKGNKKKSQELITWMGQLADKTPFSSPDLFPALTRGIGLSNGDINMAKKMLRISADMAALTPGSTVSDAMEALGDAQMGEFERMKAFNMKVTKKDYQSMGGWSGFLNEVENSFGGGSAKLSQTADGIISTLQGYRSSIMRSFGSGFLEPMKPRLSAISVWLDNNQDKWQRWKSTVMKAGSDVSEWLFSKLETGFSHIKTNYLENSNFNNLDFEGKIKFISEDIEAWWSSKGKPALNNWWESSGKPWAEKIGLFVGKSIFEGIVTGIKEGGKALGGMWKDAFKDPSLGAFGGAGVATLLASMLASLVLSPLITAISVLGKGVKGAGKIAGWLSKGKTSKATVAPTGSGSKSARTPKVKQEYRMPWTNQGAKPVLNVPNAKEKGFKLPKGLSKGLSGLGSFVKRMPVLGTALGALTIATSSKEDRPGTVGAVGGGLAGAATGAALGSAVPVIGTAIGGLIGGVIGSLGGQAVGDWLSDNWSSIKAGASDAGAWIAQKFSESFHWVSKTWSGFTDWFSSSVWIPVSEGAGAAVDWVKEKWSAAIGWFNESVWNPLTEGFDTTLSFIVGLYDIAEQLIKIAWGFVSSWFEETVWTPLKTAAGIAWDWISAKISTVWIGIQVLWGMAVSWFDSTVWTPLSMAASIAWEWITTSVSNAWLAVQTLWGLAVSWFQETIWTPLVMAANIAWFAITTAVTYAWSVVTTIWGLAVSWFEESVWMPIREGAQLLATWIGEKFAEGWSFVTGIWGAASAYFQENIWSPISNGAVAVKDAIVSAFGQAWDYVSGIFTKLGDTWDKIKQWGGKAADLGSRATDYVIERGKKRRGQNQEPGYALGTNFHPGGPAIVGDGGGPELIRYPNGKMTLSPSTDTMMNLPRGTEVLSHRKTAKYLNQVPAYADGIGFEKTFLPEEQVQAATSTSRGENSGSSGNGPREININFNGNNHYSNDMDAEKVGKIAYDYIRQALLNEEFEGGEMVVDV